MAFNLVPRGEYPLATRQMIEIAKPEGDARIIIMDEPTSALIDARPNAYSTYRRPA
jgi:ABC-type sugar transport system ATPase subunit